MWELAISIYFYSFLFCFVFLFIATIVEFYQGDLDKGIIEVFLVNVFFSAIPLVNSITAILIMYNLFDSSKKFTLKKILFKRNPRLHFCYNFSKIMNFYRLNCIFSSYPLYLDLRNYYEWSNRSNDLLYQLENAPSNPKLEALLIEYTPVFERLVKLQKKLEKKKDEKMTTQFTFVFKDTIDLFSEELEHVLFND